MNDFNKFKKIDKNIFGIGIENGIVFHNSDRLITSEINTTPIVKSIELISSKDTIRAPIDGKE